MHINKLKVFQRPQKNTRHSGSGYFEDFEKLTPVCYWKSRYYQYL